MRVKRGVESEDLNLTRAAEADAVCSVALMCPLSPNLSLTGLLIVLDVELVPIVPEAGRATKVTRAASHIEEPIADEDARWRDAKEG